MVEADELVENGGRTFGCFHLEPHRLREGNEAELEEGAARFLPSSEVDSREQRVVTVVEAEPGELATALNCCNVLVEQLPPLVDPGTGVVGTECADDGGACHSSRLPPAGCTSDEGATDRRPERVVGWASVVSVAVEPVHAGANGCR